MSTATVPVVLGKEFRKARTRAGMTQEDLAAKAKLTREYVSLLELDKRMPTLPVFVRLCRAMDISASELISKFGDQLAGAPDKSRR